MQIPKKRNFIVFPLIIYLLGVFTYTYVRYNIELKEKLSEIDHRLLIGANQIKHILQVSFPDRCTSLTSISSAEHQENMKRLNEFVESGGFEYLYTIHLIDGEMRYTSTSYGEGEDPNSEELSYSYSLKDSGESEYDKILAVFDSDGPVFLNNTDQWGNHRSCFLVQKMEGGVSYISGADYEISYIESELWKEVPISIFTGLLFFFLSAPFLFFLNKYWSIFSAKLKELNGQLVTDMKFKEKVESDLLKAKGKAEVAVETQKNFLANISHEIRTPMNGILGMSSLMKSTDLSDAQKKNLDVIEQSSEHLLKIIDDLLTFSKLDYKEIRLDIKEVDPISIVKYCFSILAEQAEANKVELVLKSTTHQKLSTDQVRLSQILINLISNAVKFSENSQVVVEINSVGNKGHLEFKVIDFGIGIDESKQDAIFEPFIQLDSSSTKQYQGAGLGLAITAKLCKKLGGEITVESEKGKGSAFVFELASLEA